MLDTVSAKELDWYAEDDSVLMIDLRSREEYAEGHICGAANAPLGDFSNIRLDRKKTLLLYCDRGARSMAVGRELSARGYRVKSVVGGIGAYRGRRMTGRA